MIFDTESRKRIPHVGEPHDDLGRVQILTGFDEFHNAGREVSGRFDETNKGFQHLKSYAMGERNGEWELGTGAFHGNAVWWLWGSKKSRKRTPIRHFEGHLHTLTPYGREARTWTRIVHVRSQGDQGPGQTGSIAESLEHLQERGGTVVCADHAPQNIPTS